MSGLYILAGFFHFARPTFYLRSMPPWVPYHSFWVYASGVVEIALGVALLFPSTQVGAAWGIILLLIGVFPANVYMYTSGKFRRIPRFLLLLRLPLQLVLIWWAYQFT